MIGLIIALDSIHLNLSALLTALSVMMIALGMVMNGVFGNVLTSFVFLLSTNAYFEGDVVVIGTDTLIVKKITLLNTYGFRPDGKWIVYHHATIAAGAIINLTRSQDFSFSYDAVVGAGTTVAQLDAWKSSIGGYIKSKPEQWKDFGFNVTNVDGVDNKLVVSMGCAARGANWSQGDVFVPIRSELFNYIRLSAAQLGIAYQRSLQPTTSVNLPAAPQLEKVPLEWDEEKVDDKESAEEKGKKSKVKEKEEKGKEKDEKKVKRQESKKDK